VGRESTSIGDRGYFHFLIHDEVGRPPSQFAPIFAVCYHACEWNRTTVGIELERFPGEPATPEQLFWMRYLVHAIAAESRGAIRAEWKGDITVASPWDMGGQWANHGALRIRQCDPHTDGWTPEEWTYVTNPSSEQKKEEDNDMWIAVAVWLDGVHAFRCAGDVILWEYDRSVLGAYGIPQGALDDANKNGYKIDNLTAKPAWDGQGTAWDRLVRTTKASETASVGSVNFAANLIRQIVREEINKTKLTG
jgi:hypothetical protein